MCYVCATHVATHVAHMCDVLGVLEIFCGIPRESLMLLYKCFRFFSEIFMDQMFLTGRGGVQGSFRATLGVASVFIHDILRPGWGAWGCPRCPRCPPLFLFIMTSYDQDGELGDVQDVPPPGFIHDILRPGWGAWRCPRCPPIHHPSVFSSVLI